MDWQKKWYESLLEIANPEFCTILKDDEPVNEAYYTPPSLIKEQEIWWCDFPFLDSNLKSKDRRAAIIKYNNSLYVVEISSIHGHKEGDEERRKRKIEKYASNYVLKDWEYEGLSKESYLVGSNILPLERANFDKKAGMLTDYDYKNCVIAVQEALKLRFENPHGFMTWLAQNDVKELNKNDDSTKIQSIYDISASKEASYEDIALVVHIMCTRLGFRDTLVYNKFSNGSGYMYCIFKQASATMVFKYFPGYYSIAEVKNYYNSKIDYVIRKESEWAEKYFSKILGISIKIEPIKLTEQQIGMIDEFIVKKATRRELMEGIGLDEKSINDKEILEHGIPCSFAYLSESVYIPKYKRKDLTYKNLNMLDLSGLKMSSSIRFGDDYKGILLHDGRVAVGYINCNITTKIIQALEIAKPYREEGLGTYLINQAIRDYGVNKLTVRSTNIPAVNLYTKLGFKVTEENKTGKYIKIYTMEK